MKFAYKEDYTNINIEEIEKMLNSDEDAYAVYIVRSHMSKEDTVAIKKKFEDIIENTKGGYRKDFVPVHQIGATQFNKTTEAFFQECLETRSSVGELIEVLECSANKKDFLLEDSFKAYFSEKNIRFRPSKFEGNTVNQFTARKWQNKDNSSLVLLPHEDFSQLNQAKKDNYEIKDVHKVIACNLCISNDHNGELVIWDFEPSLEFKKSLGIEDLGYPYPLNGTLTKAKKIEININKGDLYFINANLVHAVKEINVNCDRISLGRFIGVCGENDIVYWT